MLRKTWVTILTFSLFCLISYSHEKRLHNPYPRTSLIDYPFPEFWMERHYDLTDNVTLYSQSVKPPFLEKRQDKKHFIVNDLPIPFVKDGSVDYTVQIQKALDNHNNLVFPSFPVLINDSGLKIASNKTIMFPEGSELLLKPSAKKGYAVLDIINSKNITLFNPVIKGDRYNHLGVSGEWGMGISIKGSSFINVFNSRITNCWGDGIYIGQTKENPVSRNIVIKDAYLYKNRRDGISIISVDGLILENVYAGFQDGTSPMCGINFETNNPSCEIKNVKVINPKTEFNRGNGIQVGLSTMLGRELKHVDIQIINHRDKGSERHSFKITSTLKGDIVGGGISGVISVINPFWQLGPNSRPMTFISDQNMLELKISTPKILNSSGRLLKIEEETSILKKHSNAKFILTN